MNTLKNIFGTLLMTALLFTSCNKNNDDVDIIVRATAEDFSQLEEDALADLKQNFQFDAEDGSISLTSEKGVSIYLNASCLTLNGNPVTGPVDLEFIELFDKGSMLTTNKPTMGVLPNGDKALLISGGEFHIMATQKHILRNLLQNNIQADLRRPKTHWLSAYRLTRLTTHWLCQSRVLVSSLWSSTTTI